MTPPMIPSVTALWHLQTPHPYTHHLTASMTPCVTTARYWILLSFYLQTRSRTHIRKEERRLHLERHPVRQPGLGSANPDPYTRHTAPSTTPCAPVEPWPLTHQTPPPTTPCVTPWQRIHKICEPPPPNLKYLATKDKSLQSDPQVLLARHWHDSASPKCRTSYSNSILHRLVIIHKAVARSNAPCKSAQNRI